MRLTKRVLLSASAMAVAASSWAAPALADGELRVVYRESGFLNAVMEATEAAFEGEHEGVDVVLEPISASSRDYYTKVSLMNQSPSTAADIIYIDGFYVTADASAGYLEPLGDRLEAWDEWDQFPETIRQNGTSRVDGMIYSIPLGTDTQAIWYNREIFAQAGLPEDWQPDNWQDILDAAATIKEQLPDVVPLNIYATKANGEAATMRGLLNMMSGTPGGLTATLFDDSDQKWVVDAPGMRAALGFIHDAYNAGYLPPTSSMQDPNLQNILVEQWVPNGEVAMFIDGSWIWSRWEESGNAPWDGWLDTLGRAKLPTHDGQEPGFTSMSGGWTIGMSPYTDDKDLAFDFLTTIANSEFSLMYSLLAGSIGNRTDVIANEEYLASNPTAEFFSDLVQYTHFRPGVEAYPQVSSLIQETLEAVTVGGEDVDTAMDRYNRQLTRLVGSGNVKNAAE